jgi:hypothetical protein
MTTRTPENERQDGGELDARAANIAKRRRASRMTASDLAARPASRAFDEEVEPAEAKSYKLTKAQRAQLMRAIALHHYVDVVREVIAEESPDFPAITDSLIRYYRNQIDAGAIAEARETRARAMTSGLANKAVRVRYLIRLVEQWRKVPLATVVGGQVLAMRVEASREQRELLKQIAQELGQFAPAGTGPARDVPGYDDLGANGDTEDDAQAEEIRTDLEALLRGMAEQDNASAAAMAAAVRLPAREAIERATE